MVEDLLREYDLFHSSIVNGGKVKFNINYLYNNKVYISLVAIINGDEKKASFDFVNDETFTNFELPKILQRFLSKNVGLKIRRIMGNDTNGTLIIERSDSKDCLVVRNCSVKVMELANSLLNSINNINNKDLESDSRIIFNDNSSVKYDNYMKYNIIFDFASYRMQFFNNLDSEDYDHSNIKKHMDDEEMDKDSEQLLILNIARFAYTFDINDSENVWDRIINNYQGNEKVVEICESFKTIDYLTDSIYTRALALAEYEKNNDLFLHNNDEAVEAALQACDYSVNLFNNSYLTYWQDKEKYYSSILDGEHQAICLEYIEAHDLSDKKMNSVELKNKIVPVVHKDKELLNKFKKIKNEKLTFSTIINDPVQVEDKVEEQVEKIFLDVDSKKIMEDADDQAKRLIKIEMERDKLKKDAEEFAKMILKSEKEHKKIVEAAEEQAKRIIELQNENDELKKLADENARYLFERDAKLREEDMLREFVDNTPIKSQDVDKINNLLNAISTVKELDFAVNHPTVMQGLVMLEEKIVTYLTTHKNVVHEDDVIVPIEKEEMLETKPVIELLSMIRNTYVSSHYFEKDGRHTLINFNPVDEDTYRVSLYSIKDDSEDVLMDVFFEQYQLTDNVLKEICDIFKQDAVIVASKTDNVPPDKADYLVIDNMDNAIRFMDCTKDMIEKIKEYL